MKLKAYLLFFETKLIFPISAWSAVHFYTVHIYYAQISEFFGLHFRYLTVGNHDHGHTSDREWYQVAFSDIEPRWNLPNLAFSFKVSSQVNANAS